MTQEYRQIGSTGMTVALALLSSLASFPSQAASSEPSVGDADTAIETIVVTAQKRSQSTQDIGLSVNEISGDALQALHIEQTSDLAKVSSGLTSVNATSDGTPIFLVRGVGLDDFNANNSSAVGTYIDEVYASYPEFLAGQMFDVDRVEVLEGPQGTLYGKNTEGGAISIFSRRPTRDWEGYADLSYGRWNTVEASGAVSGPLSERVAARLSATLTHAGEGYQQDIDTGLRYGQPDRGAARTLVDWRISPDTSVLFNVHYGFDHSIPGSPSTPNIEAMLGSSTGFSVTGLLNSPPGGTQVRVGGLHLYKDEQSQGESAVITMKLDGATLTSITAFDNLSSRSLDNYDGYPSADDNWTKNYAQQQWSEELRLTSDSRGVIDWVAGTNLSTSRFSGRDAIDQTIVYGYATDPGTTGQAVTQENLNERQRSFGLFGHLETHLRSDLTLVTGLRWSQDSTAFDGVSQDQTGLISYSLNGFSGPVVPGTTLAALHESHTEGNLSWKLGLEYKLAEKTLLYTSLATSYKAGIFYGQPAQLQGDWGYARPEHVKSLEAGFKSRFLGDSLQINGALFHSDYRDRQSLLAVWGGSPGTLPIVAAVGNVPRAVIDGAEGEVVWRPAHGLELRAAGTWLNGRVTEVIGDIRGLSIYNPLSPGSGLPLTPRWSTNAGLRYSRTVAADTSGFVQMHFNLSTAAHPELGDPTTFGPDRNLDLRVGVANSESGWEASVWASNLLDSRNLSYAFAGSFGQQVSYYQKPRALGVSLHHDF